MAQPHIAEATGNPIAFQTDVPANLKECEVAFSPVQAGSGDPSPENVRAISGWTGVNLWRTGKNLLNPVWWDDVADNKSYVRYEDGTLVYQSTGYKASDYVSVRVNTEYTLHAVMGGQAEGGIAFYDSSKQYISGIQINNNTETDHTFTTPSNAAYVRFWDSGDRLPWDEVMLVYGSTAPTTYSPYTGQTYSVEFPALGKNLAIFADNILEADRTDHHVTFHALNESMVHISGTASGGLAYISPNSATPQLSLPAGTYTISTNLPRTDNSTRVYLTNSDGQFSYHAAYAGHPVTLTLSEKAEDVFVQICIGDGITIDMDVWIQVESGSTATTYEPYTNTVYGGTVDPVTGVLTVEWAYLLLNDPEQWASSSGTQDFVYNTMITDRKTFLTSYEGLICSSFSVNNESNKAYMRWTSSSSSKVGIKNSNTSYTLEDIQQMASDGDIAITYALATPITYQLTPTQIKTLSGANTLWADTNGDISIKYWSH